MISAAGFCPRGFVIGFSIAAPVGPIGVLCIRRSVAGGARIGFATGLGAAPADAVYGAVAGFGLTVVSGFLVDERRWLQLLGGAFLCHLGLRAWRKKMGGGTVSDGGEGLLAAYASTFVLTLANPATILSFVAIFASIGLAVSPGAGAATALVGGVFLGSAVWWLILSQSAGWFRSRLSAIWMTAIDRASGLILMAFGVAGIALGLMK